jgi:hypothetical protein
VGQGGAEDAALSLCAGTYTAHEASGTIVVFARGIHPSGGYRVFLAKEASAPPLLSFSLWHVRLSETDLQVVTPFAVFAVAQTTHRTTTVQVRDADGLHSIPVEPFPPTIASHVITLARPT